MRRLVKILERSRSKELAMVIALACFAGAVWAGTQQSRPAPKRTAATEEGPPNKGLGSPAAPIMMEVFSDYSCPMCRSFYLSAVRPLLEDYVATGKVYFIHRDFPLKGVQGHEHSREAARYVTAAARIGKFQEVDAALYDKWEVWTRSGSVDGVVAGVLTPRDMKRVRDMVESGKLDAYIDSDYALGTTKGVRSTPTIYVTAHGKTDVIPGNVSYSLLKRYLDGQLH